MTAEPAADTVQQQTPAPPEAPPPAAGAVAVRSETSRGLAVDDAGGARVPMPRNFAELQEMASFMSRGGAMVGSAFQGSPGACLGIITQAMRWGMDPYAVSQKAYQATKDNPNAPIAYEAQLVAAVVLRNAPLQRRLRSRYEGSDDTRKIIITGWLKGEDDPFEYESPPLATLKGKSPLWTKDPDQQLWYYGVRAWARRFVPEVIMGVYTPDERDEQREREAAPQRRVITLTGDEPAASEGPVSGEVVIEADAEPGPAPQAKTEPEPSIEADKPAESPPEPDPMEAVIAAIEEAARGKRIATARRLFDERAKDLVATSAGDGPFAARALALVERFAG